MFAKLFRRDWSIRLFGVVMLLMGAASCYLLFGGRIEPMTATGAVMAACGFLGCSGGLVLILLGAHIHDRVAVARPWGGQVSHGWMRRPRAPEAGTPEPQPVSGSAKAEQAAPWQGTILEVVA